MEQLQDTPHLPVRPQTTPIDREDLPVRERVDAWLREHAKWVAADEHRQRLRAQWHAVVMAFGDESDPARGVLRGLARAAWNDDKLVTVPHRDRRYRWAVLFGSADEQLVRGVTEADALVTALEYAEVVP